MQNTRLNSLVDITLERFGQWLQNPWRRLSLLIISLLLGNFLATAVSTTFGQQASWDILVSVILVGFSELSSWVVYGGSRSRVQQAEAGRQRLLLIEMLNALKVGLLYGLFNEALKLGS